MYMKQTLNMVGILFILWCSFSSVAHPIKLSTSLFEYDEKTSTLKIACRVFIDDFEESIDVDGFSVKSLSKKDKKVIEYFFAKSYRISINGKKYRLKYEDLKIYQAQNIIEIEFSRIKIFIKSGDRLYIENSLFFEEFKDLQSNRIIFRAPPFFSEKHYATRLNKGTVYITF